MEKFEAYPNWNLNFVVVTNLIVLTNLVVVPFNWEHISEMSKNYDEFEP